MKGPTALAASHGSVRVAAALAGGRTHGLRVEGDARAPQSDWKQATHLILCPRAGEKEDAARARRLFEETRNAKQALKLLPTWMSLEVRDNTPKQREHPPSQQT